MERTLITVPNAIPMVAVVGPHDDNLRTIEAAFPSVNITVRGNEITLRGPHADCAKLENLFNELMVVIRSGNILNVDAVNRAIEMLEHKPVDHPAEVMSLNIVSNRGRTIRPKTANQKRYVDAIEDHTPSPLVSALPVPVKNISCDGDGGCCAQCKEDQQNYLDPPCS
jgi:phosphate starvation-inducible PhoH-like protein